MTRPPSRRTTVRRGADRAVYDRPAIFEILDAGMIAHVGVDTPDGPLVLPMAYGRDDQHLYLHGALANHLLGRAIDHDICVTVTHLDGLVMARTPFHNSVNYRSVVVRGRASKVTEPADKAAALKIITDHIVENWDQTRPASDADIRATIVIRVPLSEASAKMRSGDPIDDPDDMAGPWWAGVIPVETTFGEPRVAADYAGGRRPPDVYSSLSGRRADRRDRSGVGPPTGRPTPP